MKIKVDSKGKIIGYVLIGDNPDYDTAVDINTLPEDFFDNFSPEYYLFVNGNVVTNPNYVTPVEPTPDSGPTAEQESLTAMAQQMADQQQHIASLEKALTALAQGGTKS
ncbi:DUF2977 domain-containing protein [Lactiplantibacillus paraplantarum]|uniref:DUF2977 domain-containing protein n=1 Tax=Lactiplantibacillus paraplantarum TaxID=60520 RepID=A0A4Q9XY72_9LACO|nr:DUF2977 domain-containing protein [Lactiplantibacillus paraplantarum]